jgi:hypothetical protein
MPFPLLECYNAFRRATGAYYVKITYRVDGVVGYRICLTHRRSSVRAWVDSYFLDLQVMIKSTDGKIFDLCVY